jgi:hypothetical protein
MSDESAAVPTPLLEYKRAHVGPALKEFNAALEAGSPTKDESTRYLNALRAYGLRLSEAPGGGAWTTPDPTADDAATKRGIDAEQQWIGGEISRVLSFFGGSLTAEDDE